MSLKNEKHILLIGPPNSGKTTLFNWLTGYKARVVNYPGSTVDYLKGEPLKKYNLPLKVIDTPGIYSLFPKTPSEHITHKILSSTSIECVVVTIDALRVKRELPLALQLKKMGFPVLVALTMSDLLESPLDVKALSQYLELPVFPIEGKLGKGVKELVQGISKFETPVVLNKTLQQKILKPQETSKLFKLQDQFFQKTDQTAEKFFSKNLKSSQMTQKMDRVLLHPVWGILSFFGIMMTLFSSIFWLAAPLMSSVDLTFSFLTEKIGSLGDSLFIDFLSNGVMTSFAAVFVFVPQIFILFAGICILEDSGYLARSASLMDALFSKIGLSGRSFIPFLAGYACAIPACLSARNITSRYERWIVIAVIPILTCSARLPVYSLLLSLFFYGEGALQAGLWMSVIYFGSMVLAGLSAWGLSRIIQDKQKTPFVMELPVYKLPLISGVMASAWRRSKSYIQGAGPLIFIFALVIWVALNFPRNMEWNDAEQIERSYAGQFGKKIEPVFEWMGGDWRVGISLLSAFVAREVFVSTLASLFQITQEDEEGRPSLLKKMRIAQNKRGDPVFTPRSLFSLILFFMISLQCLSTTAIVKRETGSYVFALVQLVSLNVLAYMASTGVYQLFSKFNSG